jgi:hypothetical protein
VVCGRTSIEVNLLLEILSGISVIPGIHRMHDSGSIVPHIRPKVLTDNQMSRI